MELVKFVYPTVGVVVVVYLRHIRLYIILSWLPRSQLSIRGWGKRSHTLDVKMLGERYFRWINHLATFNYTQPHRHIWFSKEVSIFPPNKQTNYFVSP